MFRKLPFLLGHMRPWKERVPGAAAATTAFPGFQQPQPVVSAWAFPWAGRKRVLGLGDNTSVPSGEQAGVNVLSLVWKYWFSCE